MAEQGAEISEPAHDDLLVCRERLLVRSAIAESRLLLGAQHERAIIESTSIAVPMKQR